MSLKVLFVSEADGWTGGTAQLLALAGGLRRRGWEVLLACRPDSGLSRHAGRADLETIPLAMREDYDLFSALALARLIERRGVALVHAHHNRAHAVCLLAKAWLRLRGRKGPVLLVSRRVSFRPGRDPFSRWKYRSRLIDRFVAVAEAVKQVLVEAGVPAGRVRVIRSGVDLSRFSPRRADDSEKRALGLPVGVPLIGKIANASPWKGQDVLLKAASLLVSRGCPAHFVLAGRDTDGPWVAAQTARLGLEGRVARLGLRDDVPKLLACLDLSVNAAVRGEGLSGALRESLAMGVPVVASDVAGNRELLQDGLGGWLFEAGKAEALAERIEWALAHPEEARAAADAWRSRALPD
ncbi:MAG: glycosyltransferase, partial [Elusimicrobia bacterium]|nr:glycosyltransferase [Elusimicrobiota bacterium]